MKRAAYALLVIAALLVPTIPQELGKLIPVEVIKIDTEGETILIETDSGDTGCAETLEQALWDLRATAPGTIYLDTAKYVLLPKETEELLVQLTPYLKESVQICSWEGEIDMKEVSVFLNAHELQTELKQYKIGMPMQTLVSENGRLKLKEKRVESR